MATFRVIQKQDQKELGLYEADNSESAIKDAQDDKQNTSELQAFEISLAC